MINDAHILIVEDDPAVGQSLCTGMEREGFRIGWQQTARTGLQYVQNHRPDLLILDVRLPDSNGFDLCRRLRQGGHHQPVLMLTVQGEETDKVLGLEMGADDFMTKPYSLRELLSRVRALLRRAYGEFARADTDRLYVADLIIDRTRTEVFRGDTPINLTPTEFKLLTFLARHPGQALSRSQIVEAVWGYEADVESERTVNVHIRRLREKVEVDPSRPSLILTVPGIGYRLVAYR
ncbi:MAG: response regulator transcription factor [Anaerolineae bacterium]|nr:response regulator transcription factor [Anaerolineae bacterium]